MIKIVFFAFGIVTLNDKEFKELERICEKLILRNLKISEKFPRMIIHINKNFLGLELMRLNTMLNMLNLKLYLGNMRLRINAFNIIQANEEMS